MSELPSSGDFGVRPPSAAALPRPAMWPDGAVDVPFDGAQGDTSTPPSARRRRVGWLAVALMVLGVVLVGLAVVRGSVAPAVAGVLVGAAGAVLAWRAGIMEDVSVSDSPHG